MIFEILVGSRMRRSKIITHIWCIKLQHTCSCINHRAPYYNTKATAAQYCSSTLTLYKDPGMHDRRYKLIPDYTTRGILLSMSHHSGNNVPSIDSFFSRYLWTSRRIGTLGLFALENTVVIAQYNIGPTFVVALVLIAYTAAFPQF